MSKSLNEYETNARVGEIKDSRDIFFKMNPFQENEKKLEEFQFINKNLEDTLQKKSNEFNQKLTNVQHELHEVEQKHQVNKYIHHLRRRKKTRNFSFLPRIPQL